MNIMLHIRAEMLIRLWIIRVFHAWFVTFLGLKLRMDCHV